jgi:hypothetical protein
LDILKRRGTKLMVSGGIILNSFRLISFRSAPFHYYFSIPNNGTLLYSIMFRFIPLYSINLNGASMMLKCWNDIPDYNQFVQDKCNSFKVTGWGGFVLKMIKLALKVSF